MDGLCPDFDTQPIDPFASFIYHPHEQLRAITEDKQRTREVLAEAGVPIPRGICIRPCMDVNQAVDEFLGSLPNTSGVVLKLLHGAQGNNVELFDNSEIDEVPYLTKMSVDEYNDATILEERIQPPRLSRLQSKRYGLYGHKPVDYNFRVLTTLSQEEPVAFDGEVRFRLNENVPVNISKDALAAKMSVLGDDQLVKRIYEIAEQATKALCRAALDGEDELVGIAGIDLMINQKKQIYVIEANTRVAGGLGTLSRLERKPLNSIKKGFLTAYEGYLDVRFLGRDRQPSYESLSRVDVTDVYKILDNLRNAEDLTISVQSTRLDEAEERIITGMSGLKPRDIAIWMAFIGYKRGFLSTEAISFIDCWIQEHPNDAMYYQMIKQAIYRGQKALI